MSTGVRVGPSRVAVDASWLLRIYGECGLSAEDARRCADATIRRFCLRRPDTTDPKLHDPSVKARRLRIRQALVKDPWASLGRFIGPGTDAALPLVDRETGALSEPAFAQTFAEAGLDPVVAMAYAKVVAFGFTPFDFYRPIWMALGRPGAIDFGVLARLDWSSIFPPLEEEPRGEATVTTVQAVAPRPATKPVIRRPGEKK